MPKHDPHYRPIDPTDETTWLTPQQVYSGQRQGAPHQPVSTVIPLPRTPHSSAALPGPPEATQRKPVSTADTSPEALLVYQALNLDPTVLQHYQGGTPDLPHVSRAEVLQALRLPPAEIAALLKRMQED
jgi:hypothetical protein